MRALRKLSSSRPVTHIENEKFPDWVTSKRRFKPRISRIYTDRKDEEFNGSAAALPRLHLASGFRGRDGPMAEEVGFEIA